MSDSQFPFPSSRPARHYGPGAERRADCLAAFRKPRNRTESYASLWFIYLGVRGRVRAEFQSDRLSQGKPVGCRRTPGRFAAPVERRWKQQSAGITPALFSCHGACLNWLQAGIPAETKNCVANKTISCLAPRARKICGRTPSRAWRNIALDRPDRWPGKAQPGACLAGTFGLLQSRVFGIAAIEVLRNIEISASFASPAR